MANFVANKVAKHVLKESATNHFGSDDPYFTYVAPTDSAGQPTGKPVKQRRPVPPGLTKQEEKVLKKVTRRAHRLDNCINFCGIRIGWSAVIGIIPAAGDMIDAFMALMVVWTCMQVKIPDTLKSRMMLNIALDFAIGLVPFLGDIADAFYRCNTRNAALLYKHLEARGQARMKNEVPGQMPASDRRPSQSRTQSANRIQPKASVPQHQQQTDGPFNEKSAATTPNQNPRHVTASDLKKLEPVKVKDSGRSQGGGWLNRLRGPKQAPPLDVENEGTEMAQRR